MINIKVSGITDLKQLKQLDGLDIEFAGLDFYKESPYYIKGKLNAIDVKHSDFDIKKVGVFFNAGFDEISQIVEDYTLDVVQLNGEESPQLCEQLCETFEVIKLFNIDSSVKSIEQLIEDYDEVCDYYLFAAASEDGDPSGQFDWKILNKAKIEKPFFLGGGIGPADGKKVKGFKHPDFYGVDISTEFEKSTGVKDMVGILQFKQSLKS